MGSASDRPKAREGSRGFRRWAVRVRPQRLPGTVLRLGSVGSLAPESGQRAPFAPAILSGLAVQPVTERVLWRLDSNTPHRADLLVLTDSRPSWVHLVDDAGWPGAGGGGPLVADYTPLLERLARGRESGFRLTVAPSTTSPGPAIRANSRPPA
ncbi:type I-E CRISPR-associated protein Cas6/Cse3/CasE [Streptomyces dubilierae]|uniref:Type I-E CRISPR-associated protein Cas6/Cse3/CasE n=1 Tax=Streptomyces dubilierae TaxID=3075533 RepID=A0ABU2P1D8_9ACTN|nr:type I-E CRISPR-associated protein Cas6/Cse3/CasE [Streptomyces sp. DSM 41921]MDT0385956.1 type I-E CRISPR-associated protein Cas6/Cse3/CasE [Streptomyces sp. DSM 41921]